MGKMEKMEDDTINFKVYMTLQLHALEIGGCSNHFMSQVSADDSNFYSGKSNERSVITKSLSNYDSAFVKVYKHKVNKR